MENKSRIYSFFIVVALFFWNPLSYYLLYRKMPVYPLSMVKLAYWLVFLIGLWCIYLINKININEKIKNIFFASSVTGILFGILALVNFFFSPPVKQKISAVVQKSTGLIFEPGVNAHYKTVEFDYIATINKLGLRNKEVQIDKKNNYRVLCFGDSWTFGWGVKDESTWPSKLQKYFQEKGYKEVEIINCGQGGQYTTVYKNYMEKIIPLLRPDLVLVGVLQLDDLAQLFENKQLLILTKPAPAIKKTSWYSKIMESFSVYMNNSVGNIVALLKSKTPSKTLQVQTSWEEAAVNKIASLTPENKIKFATLSDTIQSLFKSGNLNPALLNYYLDFQERNIIFNNPTHKATKDAIESMKNDIKGMKEICSKNKAEFVFVNMPTNIFTGHRVIRTSADILDSFFYHNNNIDSIYHSISSSYNIPYIECTNRFKNLQPKTGYFYLYDGHPTIQGYEEIALHIGEQLLALNLLRAKRN